MNNKTENIFNLRVVPWFTDGCSTFLNNLFKWLPGFIKKRITILEFGSGNSTLYFLSKKSRVISIESSADYVKFVHDIATSSGFKSTIVTPFDLSSNKLDGFDLILVQASSFSEISQLLNTIDFDIIVNDGIERKKITEQIFESLKDKIVILDNIEYTSNWGRLDRSSAKPDLIIAYRKILRSPDWRHYIFEQPEGRLGRGFSDKTGWESPHRWASAVLWPSNHLLAHLMITNLGFPIVNELGINNKDIETLGERCPFDWSEMKWLKPEFPSELDLKLDRNFD